MIFFYYYYFRKEITNAKIRIFWNVAHGVKLINYTLK